MIQDENYKTWKEVYSHKFVKYLSKEIQEAGLKASATSIIHVFNLIEIDNLEEYLRYKYGMLFIRELEKLLETLRELEGLT